MTTWLFKFKAKYSLIERFLGLKGENS